MTREEAIEVLEELWKYEHSGFSEKDIREALEIAIQSLTAISELSKSLKAVNRYEMDKKVLIGFNMAVAIFNKCFGEDCALKNEPSEQNVGMCQQNVGEMSEKKPSYNSIKTELNEDLVKEDVENADKKGISGETVSQSLVKDTDLISRDYVLSKFKELCDRCGKYKENKGAMCRCCALDDGIDYVEEAPSAEKTTLHNFEQPQTTDTDLISRFDLLNAIWQKEYGKDYDGVNMLDIPHIDIIENMPSAEKTDSVLEDIKAEIEKEIISGDSIDYINGLNMALMIINEKHISGKE